MKNKIIIFISGLSLTACYNEWIYRPTITGKVVDSFTKQPLSCTITTLTADGEPTESFINNDLGVFTLPKISSNGWTFLGMEKPKGPATTNKLIIKATNYKNDTIDYTSFSSKDNIINLGILLLEKNYKVSK